MDEFGKSEMREAGVEMDDDFDGGSEYGGARGRGDRRTFDRDRGRGRGRGERP